MNFGSSTCFNVSDGLSGEATPIDGGVGNGAGMVRTSSCTPLSTDDNDDEWRCRTLVPVVTLEGEEGT